MFWFALPAAAADPSTASVASQPDPWSGEVRLTTDHLSRVPLDETGAQADPRTWLGSRVRVGADLPLTDRAKLAIEIEGLTGFVAGQTTDLGLVRGDDTFLVARDGRRDFSRVLPRRLGVSAGGDWGSLRVGADTFGFGLGLLANDGLKARPFGDQWRGNVVGRVGTVLTPWRSTRGFRETGVRPVTQGLGFLLAGDVVIRDENAELYAGDVATQGVLGARWILPAGEVGAFTAARWQLDRRDPADPRPDRTHTFAVPADAFAALRLTPADAPVAVRIEGEVAAIRGRTTRPLTIETLDGARVASLGGVARAQATHAASGLSAVLEGGYASGDNDPRDAVVRTFRFHSDFDVGLVLFEQALPLLSARAIDRAADPSLVAAPSPGLRALVPQSVENAVYAFPVLSYERRGFRADLGWLQAWGAGDVTDPFLTATRGGGYNVAWSGASPGSRALGSEADLGVAYQWPVGALQLSASAEGGVLLPGAAFDGRVDEPLWAARGHVRVGW